MSLTGDGPRVPAWKRIGLRLKYAKDSPNEDISQSDRTDSKSIRTTGALNGDEPAPSQNEDSLKPSKKRKLSNSKQDSTELPANGSHAIASLEARTGHESSDAQASPPEPKTGDHHRRKPPRKSVAFSEDTKQEDGSNSQNEHSPDRKSEKSDSAPDQTATPSPKREKKRNKREANKATKATADGESNEVPQYVHYLEQFHGDRDSWKFNKKKQTELLKNLFNVYRIPAKHDPAITQYIAGLQGNSACERLLNDAEGVAKEVVSKEEDLESSTDDMDSIEARRNAYRDAMKRRIERYERIGISRDEYDEQQQLEMKRFERADAVLGELLMKELAPAQKSIPKPETVQPSSTTPAADSSRGIITGKDTSNSTEKPKRKKRKTRTQASSSDDSSSSSEDERPAKRGPSTVHEALTAPPEPEITTKKPSSTGNQFKGKKTIFDDSLLDQMFPKKKSYHETAPKRKAGEKRKTRGFAYVHGAKADESGSESD